MGKKSLSFFPSEKRRFLRARAGAAIAALFVIGSTGLTVFRAPLEKSDPTPSPGPPPPFRAVDTSAVQSAAVQSAPAVDAPVVRPRALVKSVSEKSVKPVKIAPRPEPRATGSANAPAYRGTLIVDSVPRGATVLINQRRAGTTPLRVQNHAAGSHAVWVELNGFQRWTSGVHVAADTTTRVSPTLFRSEASGTDTPAE